MHSCGTVPPHGVDELAHPEAGFYIVGMKSYGRAPTALLRTGYEQVRSVVAALTGDWEAARRVELALPATGVCSLTPPDGAPRRAPNPVRRGGAGRRLLWLSSCAPASLATGPAGSGPAVPGRLGPTGSSGASPSARPCHGACSTTRFSVLLVPMQRDLGWSRTVLVGGFTLAVVISGLLAPTVGRRLDHGSPRSVMGAGSVGVPSAPGRWSRAGAVAAYYAAWAGIGVAMALVLYEPAFTVIAKRYAPHHHRALTTVTLVAGTASFIFQPLTERAGHRPRLAHTPGRPGRRAGGRRRPRSTSVSSPGAANRPAGGPTTAETPRGRRRRTPGSGSSPPPSPGSSVTSFGTSVLLVAYLVDHGWTLGAAPRGRRAPSASCNSPGGCSWRRSEPGWAPQPEPDARRPGLGVILLLLSGGGLLVWPAVAVLGMSQGLNTLLRITLLVDLYGTDRIGALNGLSATPTVLARALAPLGAAFLAAATGGYAAPFLVLAATAGAAAFLGGRDL